MEKKPLYRFSEVEVNRYLSYLQEKEPNLRARIQALARKTLGQKYRIYLLGEFPFELYDPDPLYSLGESDCVVFAEHMYAMALAHDWSSFFCILQRIRYKDGQVGMLTRNHYTELDWDRNNDWLLEDITGELAGERAEGRTSVIHKSRLFKKFGIGQSILPDTLQWTYLPFQILPDVIDALQPGDFVNVVRGGEADRYVGHVGLITCAEDGRINLLHSTPPRVIEHSLMDLYREADMKNAEHRQENAEISEKNAAIKRHNDTVKLTGRGRLKRQLSYKPYFYGFKFFRLRDEPLTELIERYGPDALDIQIRMKW